MFREKFAGVIYKTNFEILDIQTPIDNILIGGIFNTFPDKLIDESIEKGNELAGFVDKKLKK